MQVIHRDVKLSNLLMSRDGAERLARYPGARFTDFFRSFILSAVADTPQEVLAAFGPHGQETLDPLNAYRFTYTIYCLAGNLEEAQKFSRGLRESGLRISADQEWWRHVVDFTCGDLDEDALLDKLANSRSALSETQFIVGVTHLAAGDRERARKHFTAAGDLKVVGYLGDHMSRALAAQLDRDPEWPRWIATR